MKHHVIYVPGLGDHRARAQHLVAGYWRLYGVVGHIHTMNWCGKEAFPPKLDRLLKQIDELTRNGDKVSLVGTSAGASAVLNAFAARLDKVSGVACICGKINNPPANSPYYVDNPAFKESLHELQRILPKLGSEDRARVMSIRPLYDGLVPPADTIIPGAQNRIIPTAGHSLSIAAALVFGSPIMIGFLKKQAI